MNRLHQLRLGGLLSAAALLLAAPLGLSQPNTPPAAKPQVEVVFCLDTTGSMGGLINAAKEKIWSISNQIASGKPTPHLKIGLIAYRDRGDEYVTKVYDLTDDLDAVYQNLMSFQAKGGGDFPESVNQALHEAVTKISWSKDAKALKIIFLVGDAPPKDYADDVKYQDTCQRAARSNIIINTIQCGNHLRTEEVWRDICRRAEGSFVQIDRKGGPLVVIDTPYDKDLTEINRKLATSTLTYGTGRFRQDAEEKAREAATLPPGRAAPRAAYSGRTGTTAAYDLLDGIKGGKVKLEKLTREELPAQLRGLSLAEQRQYLKKLEAERAELQRRAVDLDRKRSEYIQQKLKEKAANPNRDSFDQQVFRILQEQARHVNIEYPADDRKSSKK